MKNQAQKNLNDGFTQIKRWWVDRYKLRPSHELFTSWSLAEHTREMYEDLIARREEIRRSLDAGEGEAKELLERLNGLNKVLDDPTEVQDDLFDQWERELEEGKVPDLEAMPGG